MSYRRGEETIGLIDAGFLLIIQMRRYAVAVLDLGIGAKLLDRTSSLNASPKGRRRQYLALGRASAAATFTARTTD